MGRVKGKGRWLEGRREGQPGVPQGFARNLGLSWSCAEQEAMGGLSMEEKQDGIVL